MITINADWREVLSRRGTKNRVLVQIPNRPKRWQIAINELKKGGYIVWLDFIVLPGLSETGTFPINCDIYLLTKKGVILCDQNGIGPRK